MLKEYIKLKWEKKKKKRFNADLFCFFILTDPLFVIY